MHLNLSAGNNFQNQKTQSVHIKVVLNIVDLRSTGCCCKFRIDIYIDGAQKRSFDFIL